MPDPNLWPGSNLCNKTFLLRAIRRGNRMWVIGLVLRKNYMPRGNPIYFITVYMNFIIYFSIVLLLSENQSSNQNIL